MIFKTMNWITFLIFYLFQTEITSKFIFLFLRRKRTTTRHYEKVYGTLIGLMEDPYKNLIVMIKVSSELYITFFDNSSG